MEKNTVMRTDQIAEERDLVGMYLHEIARTPLLDAAQEVELSKIIEAGLYALHLLTTKGLLDEEDVREVRPGVTVRDLRQLIAEGERAKDLFLRANLRLVVSIARRYHRSGVPLLDLIQEGNLGLMRAVEKFDYTRGFKFSTYSTWWIRQQITRSMSQQQLPVRLPVHHYELVQKVVRVARELHKLTGEEPTVSDLAAAMNLTEERIVALQRDGRSTVSLDTTVGDDEDQLLGDFVADVDDLSPEDIVLARLESKRIEVLLRCLDDRSAEIMRARYGLEDGREYTLAEVAARFSMSRERIRQLEIQALGRLRELARADGLQAVA